MEHVRHNYPYRKKQAKLHGDTEFFGRCAGMQDEKLETISLLPQMKVEVQSNISAEHNTELPENPTVGVVEAIHRIAQASGLLSQPKL